MVSSRSLLVVSGSPRLATAISSALGAIGHQVTLADSLSAGLALLERKRSDLAIVDLDTVFENATEIQLLEQFRGQTTARGTKLLGLTRLRGDPAWGAVLEWGITNFLAIDGEGFDGVELSGTVAKLFQAEIFGLQHYLGPVTRQVEVQVRTKKEREPVSEAIGEFALELGCHRQLSNALATASEELITNGVSYAPKNDPPILPQPPIMVRYATDGDRIGVSVSDPFGALEPERVVSYLRRCFRRGEDQIREDTVGAGLGFYYVFHLVQSLVINIAPSLRTEVIVLLQVSASYRKHSARARSFNLFVESTARRETKDGAQDPDQSG